MGVARIPTSLSQSDRNAAAGPIGGGLQGGVGSKASTGVPPVVPPPKPIGTPNSGPDNPNTPPTPPAPPPPAPPPLGLGDPHSNEPMSRELYTNPPILRVDGTNPKLVHGYMRTTPDANPAPPGGPFFLFFLFNPVEIDIAYGLTTSSVPQMFLTDPKNPGDPSTISNDTFAKAASLQNQNLTFTIDFDRTYEVDAFMRNTGNATVRPPQALPNTAPSGSTANEGPGRDGVMWDIRALERLMGMYDQAGGTSTGTTSQQQIGGSYNVPLMAPIDVYFGGPGAYTFRGVFTSLTIELQRFSKYMIPTHCSCHMTLARLYRDPAQADISTPSASLIDAKGQVTGGGTSAKGQAGAIAGLLTPGAIAGGSLNDPLQLGPLG